MAGNAFVYGTLLADEIVSTLIRRVPRSCAASLPGYQRFGVKGQAFPAIVPSTPDCSVKGRVLFDLTPTELQILDDYEDDDYYRACASPVLEDGSEVSAYVYVWEDSLRSMLGGDWSLEAFRDAHWEEYFEMVQRCAADIHSDIGSGGKRKDAQDSGSAAPEAP